MTEIENIKKVLNRKLRADGQMMTDKKGVTYPMANNPVSPIASVE